MKRIGLFLITAALFAAIAGCGPVTRYDLTMAVAGGNGTATDLTNASPYTPGTEVSIKAVASSGYHFLNWTAPAGTFANADAPQTTFTMPAQNVTITANFAIPAWDWYDLDAIRNNLIASYILMNDLDSTTAGYEDLASPTANGGKGWQPIGTWGARFTGSLDGQGHEIRDLFIARPDDDWVGLFSIVDDTGVIRNVGVANVDVLGRWRVGALIGQNRGSVVNCYSTGGVDGEGWVGGLVGLNEGWGNIVPAPATIDDSYSTASVSGNESGIGGLVGMNGAGTLRRSYSTGTATGQTSVGGLAGFNSEGTVSDCHSTGYVSGNVSAGGLVGKNIFGGTVSNSYSTGTVTGNSSAGGLVGWNEESTVSDSFWDTQTSGQATSDGGTGKNTTEMQDIVTFSGAGWNITAVALNETSSTHIWNIVDNVTYPFLSWQA